MQQDDSVVQLCDHLVWVGDKVWRQEATVELHAFDDFYFGFHTFVFFNGDYAVVANFLHSVRDLTTDGCFAVCRNGADLCNFVRICNFACHCFDLLNNFRSCQIDAALQVHWVQTSCNLLQAFFDDCLCQNGCGGGAVTSFVVGARSHFFDHLRAHVFELVFQFDLFCYGNTVFGDAWCTERFFQNNVTAFWAQRYFNCVCQDVYTLQHAVTGFGAEFYVFSSHCCNPYLFFVKRCDLRR